MEGRNHSALTAFNLGMLCSGKKPAIRPFISCRLHTHRGGEPVNRKWDREGRHLLYLDGVTTVFRLLLNESERKLQADGFSTLRANIH